MQFVDNRHGVSNPLRLEGDPNNSLYVLQTYTFLIHYGWRGTENRDSDNSGEPSFLIHYGWRGTADRPQGAGQSERF